MEIPKYCIVRKYCIVGNCNIRGRKRFIPCLTALYKYDLNKIRNETKNHNIMGQILIDNATVNTYRFWEYFTAVSCIPRWAV